jgi:hypothetical protein
MGFFDKGGAFSNISDPLDFRSKKDKPEIPGMPDFAKLIELQGKENRVNEVGPKGSTIYSKGGDGMWTSTRTFSPELKGLYDKNLDMIGQSPDAYNERVGNAMFDRQKSLLDPVFAQQDRSLEQKLANQGLPMGGEAYNGERNRFDRMRNEAYSNAANQSVLTGTQAGAQQRTQQFNELAALLGEQQIGPTSPIDVMGPMNAANQNQWQAYNAQMGQKQQQTGNMTALASMLAMMMCWVAEELYGVDSEKTKRLRERLNARNTVFTRFYKRHGLRWAALVRLYSPIRVASRVVFEVIGRAYAVAL